MKATKASLAGVLILEPRVFGDERGFFLESYNWKTMAEVGIRENFVQDNHSFSMRHVLRGLHYQVQRPQGKLIRVVAGEILDVALDLRRSSPSFGRCEAIRLSGQNQRMFWIPAGFAHGFLVLSETAEVLYKTTNPYYPQGERCILWDDRTLKIDWPLEALGGLAPSVSSKDAVGALFAEAELPPLG